MLKLQNSKDDLGPSDKFSAAFMLHYFHCDAFAIGCFGPAPRNVWRSVISYRAWFESDSALLKQFASSWTAAGPTSVAALCSGLHLGEKPDHLISDLIGSEFSFRTSASVLMTGRTEFGEQYLAVLIKDKTESTDYQNIVVSQLQAGMSFSVFVGELSARADLYHRVEALEGGYNNLRLGMLMMNEQRQITYVNDCAREILGGAFGHSATVASSHQGVTPAVERFVSVLVADFDAAESSHGDAHLVTLWRKLRQFDERIPFHVMRSASDDQVTFYIVFPDPIHRIEPSQFLSGLGLTESESRLASCIISGMSLKTAASELELSEESARTYLKRVFSKMGVNRQAELVSAVAKLSAPINGQPYNRDGLPCKASAGGPP
jgi:DNA-binding CsgD family transcriptional regulator